MKREILFRGKCIETGTWHEGDLVQRINHDDSMTYLIEKNDFNEFRSSVVIAETVGQFTGLLDKNGNKIFEGYIVSYDNGTVAVVNFNNGSFYGYDGKAMNSDEAYLLLSPNETPFGDDFEIEIIGNIHDNSNML